MGSKEAAGSTDEAWERLAREDPYWAVLADDRFHTAQITEGDLLEFWSSGERHIERMLSVIEHRLSPGFAPRSALDFGCGVGRLLAPLATRAERVYGVDVSDTMRRVAGEHVAEGTKASVTLAGSVAELGLAPRSLDFVHSTLVFQHIRRPSGERIFAELVSLLGPGGCGAIHFFLGRRAAWWRRAVGAARARSRVVNALVSVTKGTLTTKALPWEMNSYDLRRLLVILSDAGVSNVWVESAVTPEGVDAILFFRRD